MKRYLTQQLVKHYKLMKTMLKNGYYVLHRYCIYSTLYYSNLYTLIYCKRFCSTSALTAFCNTLIAVQRLVGCAVQCKSHPFTPMIYTYVVCGGSHQEHDTHDHVRCLWLCINHLLSGWFDGGTYGPIRTSCDHLTVHMQSLWQRSMACTAGNVVLSTTV
jgi:hypothetical protein